MESRSVKPSVMGFFPLSVIPWRVTLVVPCVRGLFPYC